MVNAKSKWIKVYPMSGTTASATIRALRFPFETRGLPEELVSDNGPQLIHGSRKDRIPHCLSSPYYSASNGEVKRAVRTFKELIKTMKDEPGTAAEK